MEKCGGSVLRPIRQHLLKQRGNWKTCLSHSLFSFKVEKTHCGITKPKPDATRLFKIKAQSVPVLEF